MYSFISILWSKINVQGCCTVRHAQQEVAWSKSGRCTRVSVVVRQEEGIVWQQAIKQMFPLYLYSRHGYCVSSSDGSSTPCHIYISLFFVHLPLFSFSQTASFFSEAFSVFVLKMTSFLPLQADPLRPRGGVFDSLLCNYVPLSSQTSWRFSELHTVSCVLVIA